MGCSCKKQFSFLFIHIFKFDGYWFPCVHESKQGKEVIIGRHIDWNEEWQSAVWYKRWEKLPEVVISKSFYDPKIPFLGVYPR